MRIGGKVLALIRDPARSGMTVIVATRGIGVARAVAEQLVVVEAGRIVEAGEARAAAFLASVI